LNSAVIIKYSKKVNPLPSLKAHGVALIYIS